MKFRPLNKNPQGNGYYQGIDKDGKMIVIRFNNDFWLLVAPRKEIKIPEDDYDNFLWIEYSTWRI